MSKLLTYMPHLVVLSWVAESGLFVSNDWYYNNYYTINNIDTALVFLSFMHFFMFYKIYGRAAKRLIYLMAVICCYQLSDYYLTKEAYFIGYVGILFFSIFTIIMLEIYEPNSKL